MTQNSPPSAQQTLNARAKAIGATIELFNGWTAIAKDGNVYMVKKKPQLNALINNLEMEAKDGN